MNGTVLDILIYVFDRYMFDEAKCQRGINATSNAGSERQPPTLDWLGTWPERHRPALGAGASGISVPMPLRVYSTLERRLR
jgi:hypothetical protein